MKSDQSNLRRNESISDCRVTSSGDSGRLAQIAAAEKNAQLRNIAAGQVDNSSMSRRKFEKLKSSGKLGVFGGLLCRPVALACANAEIKRPVAAIEAHGDWSSTVRKGAG